MVWALSLQVSILRVGGYVRFTCVFVFRLDLRERKMRREGKRGGSIERKRDGMGLAFTYIYTLLLTCALREAKKNRDDTLIPR